MATKLGGRSRFKDRTRRRPAIETLEGRTLLAVAIETLTAPESLEASEFGSIAAGSDGNLWMTMVDSPVGQIVRMTPTGDFSVFPVDSSSEELDSLASGPDGNIWFTRSGVIGNITPQGVVTEYDVPAIDHDSGTVDSGPDGIVAGPDGNLWFSAEDAIGEITTDGEITEYPEPGVEINSPLASSPEGVWFTTSDVNENPLVRIEPGGMTQRYAVPLGNRISAITTDPDGDPWFVEGVEGGTQGAIGTVNSAGAYSERRVPSGASAGSFAPGIEFGADGALWISQYYTNTLFRMTTDGSYSSFVQSEDAGYQDEPHFFTSDGMTVGPDGNLYLAEGEPQVQCIDFDADQPTLGAINTAPDVYTDSAIPFAVAAFSDTDLGAVAADFSTTIDFGDGTGTRTAGVVRSLGAGEFEVDAVHDYQDDGTYGTTVTVTDALDGGSAVISQPGNVTVRSLFILPLPDPVTVLGPDLIDEPLASFDDPLGGGLPGAIDTYQGTIDWGDGSGPSAIGDPTEYPIEGDHDYPGPGTYDATISIRKFDASGDYVTSTSSVVPIHVLAAPTDFVDEKAVLTQDHLATVALASLTDTDPDFDPSKVVVKADSIPLFGGTAGASIVSAGSGKYDITMTVETDHLGSFPVTISIGEYDIGPNGTFPDSPIEYQATVDVVAAYPLTASATSIQGTPGEPLPVDPATGAAPILARFFDDDPNLSAIDFSGQINWGDGTTDGSVSALPDFDPGDLITADPAGGYEVRGQHTYQSPGIYQVRLIISELNTFSLLNPLVGAYTELSAATTTTITVADPTIPAVPPPDVSISGAIVPTSAMKLMGTSLSTTDSSIVFQGHAGDGVPTVEVEAVPAGTGAPIVVGEATPDQSGNWKVIGAPLPAGRYRFEAIDASDATTMTSDVAPIIPVGPITDVLVASAVNPSAAIVPNDSMDLVGPRPGDGRPEPDFPRDGGRSGGGEGAGVPGRRRESDGPGRGEPGCVGGMEPDGLGAGAGAVHPRRVRVRRGREADRRLAGGPGRADRGGGRRGAEGRAPGGPLADDGAGRGGVGLGGGRDAVKFEDLASESGPAADQGIEVQARRRGTVGIGSGRRWDDESSRPTAAGARSGDLWRCASIEGGDPCLRGDSRVLQPLQHVALCRHLLHVGGCGHPDVAPGGVDLHGQRVDGVFRLGLAIGRKVLDGLPQVRRPDAPVLRVHGHAERHFRSQVDRHLVLAVGVELEEPVAAAGDLRVFANGHPRGPAPGIDVHAGRAPGGDIRRAQHRALGRGHLGQRPTRDPERLRLPVVGDIPARQVIGVDFLPLVVVHDRLARPDRAFRGQGPDIARFRIDGDRGGFHPGDDERLLAREIEPSDAVGDVLDRPDARAGGVGGDHPAAADRLAVVESRGSERLRPGGVEQRQVIVVFLLALILVVAIVEDENPGRFRRPSGRLGVQHDR